ncbi:hypothetical protein [Desertihabitans brevis]|nr:hypothetical protein [Desertihabitans brevis]
MSSVLHPAGPEEPRVYWMRRAAVLAVVALVVLVLVWAFRPSGDDVLAVPADTPSPTAPSSEASPSVDPTETAGDAETAEPTPTPTPKATATAKSTPTAKPTPTPTPKPTPTPTRDAGARAEEEEQEADPVTCDSEQLRVTLVGSGSVRSGEDQELALSVINGMSEACQLMLDEKTFELRIYSGTDRIWTTDHCAAWVPAKTTTLQPEQAHEWSMTWPGLRSDGDCSLTDTPLRAGTYVATALFQQADPVQLVMRLR